jgi:tripartite-type tricarboxylate transporter receptor subunit TctC
VFPNTAISKNALPLLAAPGDGATAVTSDLAPKGDTMLTQRSWLERFTLALMMAFATSAPVLAAEPWPQRPVRIIVPIGAGSGSDIAARLFAERLAERWKVPTFIENRPGADGLIGTSAFAGMRDDHTLLYWNSSAFTLYPLLQQKLSYDPHRDLIPIFIASENTFVIAASNQSKLDSLGALSVAARSQPGNLNYNGGAGELPDLFAGLLKHMGIELTQVPYRDATLATQDLAEGRLDIYATLLTTVLPLAQAGKIKLLGVTGRRRSLIAPGVPTAVEQGFPDGEFDGLTGFFGPRGMPTRRRDRIAADIRALATDPHLVDRLGALAQTVRGSTSAEFAASIDERYAKMAAIVSLLDNKPAH